MEASPVTDNQLPPTLTIKGRRPVIRRGDDYWWISAERDDGHELYRDGVWRIDIDYGTDYWPTHAAAVQFCLEHADPQPAGTRDASDPPVESPQGDARQAGLDNHRFCSRCGQSLNQDSLPSGEYRCPLCGQMTVHDPVESSDARQAGYEPGKRYSSVLEMVRDTCDKDFADELESQIKNWQADSYPKGWYFVDDDTTPRWFNGTYVVYDNGAELLPCKLSGPLVPATDHEQLRQRLESQSETIKQLLKERNEGVLAYNYKPLAQRLAEAERLVEIQRPATKTVGNLFCWCLENLQPWPPIEGEWVDDVKRRLKQLTASQAEAAKLRQERDAAIAAVGEWAGKCGEADGKLKASELAGILEAWKQRAEQAEAERDRLREKLERIQRCVKTLDKYNVTIPEDLLMAIKDLDKKESEPK